LDMGFIHDIKRTITLLPKKRQNLLFSATFSEEIKALAKGLIHDPVEISVAPANSTAKTVSQRVYPVDKSKRTALLCHLIKHHNWQQVLVFTRTKHGANRLVRDLEKAKINAAAIHGNKSQSARMNALNGFKLGELRVLVATDIVARGLDIQELPYVVNFDLPNIYEDYVHRIGRTGRAGASGEAISFVSHDVASDLFGIERLIQELIPRVIEKGFEPVNPVAESVLDTRPIKPKKPKKPKKAKLEQTPESETKPNKPSQKPKPQKQVSGTNARGHNKQRSFDTKAKKDKSATGNTQGEQGKAGQSTHKPGANKPTRARKPTQNGTSKQKPRAQKPANKYSV
jgi:ATP-dependent RNA helicase RhlE